MSEDRKEPDKHFERDVGDLRVEAGKLSVEIRNIKENLATNIATKTDVANSKAEIWKSALSFTVTVLAAAIGAFMAIFSGLVKFTTGS